ncbi:MAG: ABC transporter permease [Actinobacteria bacterium]|nr:ABC transporter permease [Actinomycetota bacterium]MBU1493933.1 ABC transporter permease [Actinomycetota bacterium]
MKAMILKEFRQLRRDKRTVAMLIAIPIVLLTVFGYAARFDITDIPTAVLGPGASVAEGMLQEPFRVTTVDPAGDAGTAHDLLRDGDAIVAIVTGPTTIVYVDGTELFTAQSALRRAGSLPPGVQVEILFNPELSTANIMIPGLIGFVLLAIGTIITSLGVVRERAEGTIEQLAVMPLRPRDVIVGKIAPYFMFGVLDLVLITVLGLVLFDVPFRGSILLFAMGGLLFLFVALGFGVLISTVSQSQGEAIQLAIMVMIPQILLSGMIFPLQSMPMGVRWIAYLLPLTYFVMIMRGVFLKATPFHALSMPYMALLIMAVVVFGLAVLRFRRDLAPTRRASRRSQGAPA